MCFFCSALPPEHAPPAPERAKSRQTSDMMSAVSLIVQNGCRIVFVLFFLQFWFFLGFRAWCDLYSVLQVCRMVSAQKNL